MAGGGLNPGGGLISGIHKMFRGKQLAATFC